MRVLIVGDVLLNREGLASLIRDDGRLDVVAHVALGERARIAQSSADAIVVDTPAQDAPTVLRQVAECATAPLVALGAPEAEEQVIALAELGVIGFVEREASLDELIGAVASAARNEASLPPRIGTALLRRVSSRAPRQSSEEIAALTMRERQVVHLVAEGLTNKEISARLCIEVATVKNHVHNILEKLKVNGRSEAVARLRTVDGEDSLRMAGDRVSVAGSTTPV